MSCRDVYQLRLGEALPPFLFREELGLELLPTQPPLCTAALSIVLFFAVLTLSSRIRMLKYDQTALLNATY